MKNKSILIITPYFAPQSHAAVFRAYKLAKYLSRSGWKVHVLTEKQNYLYNEDHNLEKEIPNVTISRVDYIEPSLRGLRMKFLRRDESFVAAKQKLNAATTNLKVARPPHKLKSLYHWFLENLSYNPDAHWTWI